MQSISITDLLPHSCRQLCPSVCTFSGAYRENREVETEGRAIREKNKSFFFVNSLNGVAKYPVLCIFVVLSFALACLFASTGSFGLGILTLLHYTMSSLLYSVSFIGEKVVNIAFLPTLQPLKGLFVNFTFFSELIYDY